MKCDNGFQLVILQRMANRTLGSFAASPSAVSRFTWNRLSGTNGTCYWLTVIDSEIWIWIINSFTLAPEGEGVYV